MDHTTRKDQQCVFAFQERGSSHHGHLDSCKQRTKSHRTSWIHWLFDFTEAEGPESLDQDGFVLEFPEPLLVAKQDSLRFTMIDPKQQKFNAPYTFTRDTADLKRYILMPVDEFKKGNEYELFIPQFAFKDIYGNTNDSTKLKVSLPNDEKLSSIAMQLTNVDTKYIIELVNDTRDKIFRRYTVTKDSTLLFPYLKEGDYSIRITQDLNANGRLDIGDVLAGKLPEKVRLYRLPGGEAIIKVGERMDIEQSVDLKELFNN